MSLMSNPPLNIIITGGASGLGRYLVEHYITQGCNVVSLDLMVDSLRELELKYDNFIALPCDLTQQSQIDKAFESIKEKFGVMNMLINNAGIIHNEPLFNFFGKDSKRHNIDAWKRVIDINLTSVFSTTNYFVEQLAMSRKKGVIINMSSVSSKGTAGQSAYSASKAGVNALTSTWAKELGVLGIRVISISPGYIDSDAMHAAVPDDIQKEIIQKTALRKLGHKENILQAVEAAIQNDFMTGNILDVDGGYTNS